MGRLKYSIENNGKKIDISNTSATEYTKEIGAQGFGVAPTELRMLQGAGGGARWRNTRRGPREIGFPILIFGEDPQIIEDRMRKLVSIMNDTYTTPRLIATYPDGSRWMTEFHYSSGADAQHGVDTDGKTYARWPLILQSPSPYFTAEDATPYSLRAANIGKGLIRTGNGGLTKLQLSSSQAIGTIQVVNNGDVDAFPVWTVKGPGDSFRATRAVDGASFFYEDPILGIETIVFNTHDKTVTDQLGQNRYESLAGAPKLFAIPPGTSQIQVQMNNATADTLVSMYFKPRRELIF